jgi:hypothetical protein
MALKLNRCRCLVHLAPLAGRGRSGPAGHDAIQLEDEKPANLSLRLELDAGNIGQLEAMPCEDIFTDLESRARDAFQNPEPTGTGTNQRGRNQHPHLWFFARYRPALDPPVSPRPSHGYRL